MTYRDDFRTVEREGYWTLMRGIVALLVLTVVGFGFTLLSDSFNFISYKFWAPKQEAVRRQVYEQTKSYKQGSIQRLNTLCSQVSTTDDDHKPMIYDVINHEFAEWSTDDVPDYLRSCLATARR
jgi:uncharacterized phage-associated protein